MTATSARQVTVCASAKGGQGCTGLLSVWLTVVVLIMQLERLRV